MSPPSRRIFLLRAASALAVAGAVGRGHAQLGGPKPQVDLTLLQVQRAEDGLILSYNVRFDLPREVEDALYKGVALVFVARAEVFRERWYWSDKTRAIAERRWRLAYQPLTRRWRITFDGLSQSYPSLAEAMGVMQRSTRWRIMDSAPAPDDRDHYVEFSFQLDRDELPRPLQLGLGEQSEWALAVQRRLPVTAVR